MKPQEIIDDKVNKKELFSIHSIMNEFSLDVLDAKKVLKLALDSEKLYKYFICICPKCGGKCGDGIFSSTIYGKARKCYSCNNDFKVSEKNVELLFDARTMKDKISTI